MILLIDVKKIEMVVWILIYTEIHKGFTDILFVNLFIFINLYFKRK